MKQITLFLIFFFCGQFLFSQTMEGDALIGGTANFGSQFIENSDDLFFINLNPNYGKFVADNIAVGGRLGLGFGKLNEISNTNFSFLPFGRYYFGEPEVIRFYADVGAGLFLINNKGPFGSNSANAFQFQIGVGAAYFVAKNVSLDFLIAFNNIGGDIDDKRLSFNFGFQIYLVSGGE